MSSYRRIRELFTVQGLEACTFKSMKNPNLRHITCGKVAMEDRNGRELIGCVFDEVGDSLTIRIERSDVIINLSRPIQIDGNYQYIPVDQADYIIKQFWPLRLKLTDSGQSAFIIN